MIMIGRLLLLHSCLIAFTSTLQAQGDIEILKSGMSPANNYVRNNNAASLGDKTAGGINYSDIEGTPFWDAQWKTALLMCTQNRAFMLTQVRLNLYNGDIHYMDSTGKEMVATDIVERVIFYNGADTTKASAVFEKFSHGSKNNFYKVLNGGNIKLLKLISADLESRLDPLAGKTINKFIAKSGYYISINGIIKPLKKLDKESVFDYVTSSLEIQEWLKANKSTLKNESQVVSFLNYYNDLVM